MPQPEVHRVAVVRAANAGARQGTIQFGGYSFRCALGAGGCRHDKREGDGATPIGLWPVRQVFYRADRLTLPTLPRTALPIGEQDGRCDAPGDPSYNRPVQHPYPASAEHLWRKDGVYDVIVVLGYNDDPVRPGLGSAIFMHVARPDYAPTTGCVALSLPDLITLLRISPMLAAVRVEPPGS